MMCFCFFFFKQKTAYEMRISDWSSDVCSSDLRGRRSSTTASRSEGPCPNEETGKCGRSVLWNRASPDAPISQFAMMAKPVAVLYTSFSLARKTSGAALDDAALPAQGCASTHAGLLRVGLDAEVGHLLPSIDTPQRGVREVPPKSTNNSRA